MDFDTLAGHLDYPMVVVTVAADDGPAGCLVGFHTQVSIHPARYLVCLSTANHTARVAPGEGGHLGVHFLSVADAELARWFGGVTADEVDKAGHVAWEEGPAGVPLVVGVAARFVGRTEKVLDLGDHRGHVLAPIAAEGPDADLELLMFRAVRDVEPGHPA